MSDPLKPDITLLIKLGSIIVHQQESASSDGHYLDKIATDALMADPEVKGWLETMTKMAFLPVPRSKR